MSKEDKLFDNLYSKYKDEYSEIFSEYESGTYTKNDIITFFNSETRKKEKRDEMIAKEKYKEVEKCCNDNNFGKELSELMVSDSEYITSVVEHVAYAEDFTSGASFSSRSYMETLIRNRRNRHNDAIQKTISLSKELISKGVVFYPDFFDVDKISSISQDRRDKFGDFIFSFQNARAKVLRERELEEREKGNFINDLKRKTIPDDIIIVDTVERNYRIKVPSKQDDLNKEFK